MRTSRNWQTSKDPELARAARRYEKRCRAAANSPRRRALLDERTHAVAEVLLRLYGPQASEPDAWALFVRHYTAPFTLTLEERDRVEAMGARLLMTHRA